LSGGGGCIMFEQMVSDLKNGLLPDTTLLRKRFDAALVKKMGVIRTPYSFWPADTKINPPAKQLLWATILLKDTENCKIVEAIISAELEEQQRAKGLSTNMQTLATKVLKLVQSYILEFIELAPHKPFRDKLQLLTTEIFPDLQDHQ